MQAYISPPIAACFIFGILWPRLNGTGAISSLLTGFGLGALRFVFEILDKTQHFTSPALRALLDINFLHYAIIMFIICAAVLILVSLKTEAPEPWRLAGVTFATIGQKIQTAPVQMIEVPRSVLTQPAPAGGQVAGVSTAEPEVAEPVVVQYKPKPETPLERGINVIASLGLVALVVSLWIYFR